jgi:hypothetical protein
MSRTPFDRPLSGAVRGSGLDDLESPACPANCNTLEVRCPTCSGGVYGDQLEDHDQWCPTYRVSPS